MAGVGARVVRPHVEGDRVGAELAVEGVGILGHRILGQLLQLGLAGLAIGVGSTARP